MQTMLNLMSQSCLNPYYTGSYSMSDVKLGDEQETEAVLILIILEVTL